MTFRRSALARRGLLLTAGVLTLSAAFVFGFLAGRVGRVSPGVNGGGVLDEAAARIRSSAAQDVSPDRLNRAAIEGMLAALGDRHAAYYAATDYAQFQRLLDGRDSGVGLWLGRTDAGAVEVTSVLPESPAATAGLQVGDEVTSVAGQPVRDRAVSDIVAAMRGTPGTTVGLVVRRNRTDRTVTLRRADVSSSDVLVDDVTAGVARIRVAAFTRGVGREVRTALDTLRKRSVTSIVLDLRGNPGGLLHEGVEVASAFLDGGVVVSYQGRTVADQTFTAVGRGDTASTVVVLVDGGTASAAEVVAGALQDRDRALVVGARTYGKGSVQQPYRLSDGSAVEFTVALYYTPKGRSVDRVGIAPDVEVRPTADPRVALQRAVEVLTGSVAEIDPPRG